MQQDQQKRTKDRERTLLTALLLSAPGPLILSYAAFTSGSAAQMADFLRRTSELIATFVSWFVYRKLRKNPKCEDIYADRMERFSNRTVAITMCLSGIILIMIGILRLYNQQQSAKTTLGLIVATLGFIVNLFFWQRYHIMNKKQPDAVIAGQERLYRGKASVDICIVAALGSVTLFPGYQFTVYIDAFGSIIVALYLLYNGIDLIKKTHRQTYQ